MDAIRVLLAEDNDLVREALVDVLGMMNIAVVEAVDDGDVALRWLQANPNGVDIVVTDATMRRMGGVELITRCLAEGLSRRFVLLSGDAREVTLVDPRVSILVKPFRPHELAAAIRELTSGPDEQP